MSILFDLQRVHFRTHENFSPLSSMNNHLAFRKRFGFMGWFKFVLCSILFGIMVQPVFANRIQDENALLGNPEWQQFPWAENNEIEGYASKVSVEPGQSIKFYVNSLNDSNYTITIYRLGWYKGVGARRVSDPVSLTSIKQVLPKPDSSTGLIEANWVSPYSFSIPPNWVSGVYVVTVVGNQTGLGRYIPFVVTNSGRSSAYLFQTAVTTWQAYNGWGGKSLYQYNSSGNNPARKVSFNRPYADGGGLGIFLEWELNMLRFLEREGYDVTYQTDIDTHQNIWSLLNHKAVLSVGHDEYWTLNMRNNVENARNFGVNLGFFGANACFWQIRLENSSAGQANRTILGYKYFAPTEDPYALDSNPRNDNLITTQWRLSPVDRPENALIGIMYSTDPVNGDIVVTNASHWIYKGTGLKNGDHLTGLLGYEIDSYFNNGQAPANTTILAHSPVPGSTNLYGDMSVYTRNCHSSFCINRFATVFATGSMQFVWGLDGYGHSNNLESNAAKQITRNVLARFANVVR